MKYISYFANESSEKMSLEIYKIYDDSIIKEVKMVNAPVISMTGAKYMINGGLCTSGVKFSLLGTNSEDLMSIALSELTDYKVAIKNITNNKFIYLGYLVNGVYECDFSKANNFEIQFAASDFKILEDTKGCTINNYGELATFQSLFAKSCYWNDFKDIMRINIMTSTITVEDFNRINLTNEYAVLTNSIKINTASLYDEKINPVDDFQILDGLLSQFGFVLMQWNGDLYLYEVAANSLYNDTYNITLSNFNGNTYYSIPSEKIGWDIVNLPNDVSFYGSQEMNVSDKKDKLIIQPAYIYAENYAKFNFEVNKPYDEVISGKSLYNKNITTKVQTLYNVPEHYIDRKFYIDGSCQFLYYWTGPYTLETTTMYGIWQGDINTSFTLKANNPYIYTTIPNRNLYLKMTFDAYCKGKYPDPQIGYAIGMIYLKDKNGNVIGTQEYFLDDGDSIINREWILKVKSFNKKFQSIRGFTDEQKSIFLFKLPLTNDLNDLQITFRYPYQSHADTSINCVDYFGVTNIDLELVTQNNAEELSWVTYTPFININPEQIMADSNIISNNIKKEEKLNCDYITNTGYYPYLKNSMIEKDCSNNLKYVDKFLFKRSSKLVYDSSINLDNIKIDNLFKQLNTRTLELSCDLYYDVNLISPVKKYVVDYLTNKYFIMDEFELNLKSNIINLKLKEIIQ